MIKYSDSVVHRHFVKMWKDTRMCKYSINSREGGQQCLLVSNEEQQFSAIVLNGFMQLSKGM